MDGGQLPQPGQGRAGRDLPVDLHSGRIPERLWGGQEAITVFRFFGRRVFEDFYQVLRPMMIVCRQRFRSSGTQASEVRQSRSLTFFLLTWRVVVMNCSVRCLLD